MHFLKWQRPRRASASSSPLVAPGCALGHPHPSRSRCRFERNLRDFRRCLFYFYFREGNRSTPQYWKILDRPLLYYTLEVFDSIEWIDRVVVAVSQDNLEPMQQQVGSSHFIACQ